MYIKIGAVIHAYQLPYNLPSPQLHDTAYLIYRMELYHTPVIRHGPGGEIHSLRRGAHTNTRFVRGFTPEHGRRRYTITPTTHLPLHARS